MDKNAIKRYAVWARRELISKVSQRAAFYGITDGILPDVNSDNVNGKIITLTEKKQLQALISMVKREGFEQVMEEVAYTWFNRFVAIRYMEVNGFLPTHVRVFTNESNEFKPQILDEAINLELDGLDMKKVYDLKDRNQEDELYKYLLITECNSLNSILPYMFQKIEDYTELLIPDYLLREGSVIEQMISQIPEEDWTDQVQIIGWMYQYYNSEKKDEVFAKKERFTKEEVPAATQLFTPDWIVRYMVENSLGRLWTEGHPNEEIKKNWKYYLEEAQQEPEVEEELKKIRAEYSKINPEDIKVIDPCMGSGHILVYAFEVLMQIYESAGYTQRDAAELILEKNIYGLDIDDRAGQLAYFAVMMMARKYSRRILTKGIVPNVMAIQDSANINVDTLKFIAENDQTIYNDLFKIKTVLQDAKEYGSILNVPMVNFDAIYRKVDEVMESEGDLIGKIEKVNIQRYVLPILKQVQVMTQKYDVCVTNPPYMGAGGMSGKLSDFVKEYYPDGKSDLFACFIEKCGKYSKPNGMYAMITQHAFMFLSSYEKLREKLMQKTTINMAHLGARAFDEIGGEVVQTTAFVNRNSSQKTYLGTYARLVDVNGEAEKESLYLSGEHRHTAKQENFSKIPGMPVAYWVSEKFISDFGYGTLEAKYFSGGRTKTHNNEKYIRLWHEISNRVKWQKYDKGGEYRKWYGNHDAVVDWSESAKIEYESHGGLYNQLFVNKIGICWTLVSSGKTGFRVKVAEHHYDMASPVIFNHTYELDFYVLGFLNSKVAEVYLGIMNPTMNMGNTYVLSLPIVANNEIDEYKITIERCVKECIDDSKEDWDSFETSWNFVKHQLINGETTISASFDKWQSECEERFAQLKKNEEELNRIFIDIYGLQDELTPEVEDKDVTVRKADIVRDVKSFISYAVGCMFGRYSLDTNGLVYAGGDYDSSKYSSFIPDSDNIIPICDDEYFEDDIVGRFVDFVKVVYGEETLEDNLKFIAGVLGGKGTPREVIRNYFLNDFFADHCKIYQKRPIYWLFDSGKKNGFKALIYMHRYQPDTIARIRTDYVHEMQSRYRTTIEQVANSIDSASSGEKVKLTKRHQKLMDQAEEIRAYEEKIHHLADQMIPIDLDDGVKVNYAKFQDVLGKIK